MQMVTTKTDLRQAIAALRAQGARIGFAPTMGALHEGHLSLIDIVTARGGTAVASIFVNPAQFAAHEDLGSYPRTLDADLEKLERRHCAIVYCPTPDQIYPPGFDAKIEIGALAGRLEGASRSQFFGGVALVVAKLFNQVKPDFAVFGEKDYQQLLVVRRLCRDLDFDIEILAGPTLREADGLAMSSRNAYLGPAERAIAGRLNGVLRDCAANLQAQGDIAHATEQARSALLAAGFHRVDYVELACADTLEPLPGPKVDRPARLLAAAIVGRTRLIDNVPVSPPLD